MSILRSLFGDSRREIWAQLAHELNARRAPSGRFGMSDRIDVMHGEWTLVLEFFYESAGNSTIPVTRMRAAFLNREGLRFRLRRSGFFTQLLPWLAGRDVLIGRDAFDEAYIVDAADSDRITAILDDDRLINLLMGQRSFDLRVVDNEGFFGQKYGPDVDLLEFRVTEEIKDDERLKALFELFALLLDRVCATSAAYRDLSLTDVELAAPSRAVLLRTIEVATAHYSGFPAILGAGVETPVFLPMLEGERGLLRAEGPELPAATSDLTLRASVPTDVALELKSASGLNRLFGRDHPDLDDGALTAALVSLLDDLDGLDYRVAIDNATLDIEVKATPLADVERRCRNVLDGWARMVAAARGVPLLGGADETAGP